MTLYDRRKQKLIDKLKDEDYRKAFVEENFNVRIPFQLKTIREQRGWTQKRMEELTGEKQPRISTLEDPNYSSFTLSTLVKFASYFDVGLMVKFVPISTLVEHELNLSADSLEAVNYEDDPYFKEKIDVELIPEMTAPKQEEEALTKFQGVANMVDFINKRNEQNAFALTRTKQKQDVPTRGIAL